MSPGSASRFDSVSKSTAGNCQLELLIAATTSRVSAFSIPLAVRTSRLRSALVAASLSSSVASANLTRRRASRPFLPGCSTGSLAISPLPRPPTLILSWSDNALATLRLLASSSLSRPTKSRIASSTALGEIEKMNRNRISISTTDIKIARGTLTKRNIPSATIQPTVPPPRPV